MSRLRHRKEAKPDAAGVHDGFRTPVIPLAPAGGVARLIQFPSDHVELAFDIAKRNEGEFLFPRLRPGPYDIDVLESVETGRRARPGTIDLTEDTTRDLVLADGEPEVR